MSNFTKVLKAEPGATGADISMLLLRLTFGVLMIPHGYAKFVGFQQKQENFMHFMGLSGSVSLTLTIFAELVCAVFITVGLFTRLASIPLIVTAMVIVFWAHGGDIFGEASSGFFYLIGYVVIFIMGPGKYSADAMILARK